jgi:hypothetical protein
MRTVLRELLVNQFPDKCFSESIHIHPCVIRWNTTDLLHQLLCDCMATAMYRCMEHIPLDREGLTKVRMAEYGFSKEEIEKSITKLENE